MGIRVWFSAFPAWLFWLFSLGLAILALFFFRKTNTATAARPAAATTPAAAAMIVPVLLESETGLTLGGLDGEVRAVICTEIDRRESKDKSETDSTDGSERREREKRDNRRKRYGR